MAIVTINETNLTNIAEAIREKNGTTNTYKPSEMPAAIAAIQGGGGEGLEREEITLSSSYIDGWLSDTTSSKVSYAWDTSALKPYYPMFLKTLKYMDLKAGNLDRIAYEATQLTDHLKGMTVTLTGSTSDSDRAFYGCYNLTHLPEISGTLSGVFAYFCSSCYSLKDVSGLKNVKVNPDRTSAQSDGYGKQDFFNNCYSLRSIPSEFLKEAGRRPKCEYSSASGTARAGQWFNSSTFYNCYSLDEVIGYGVSFNGMGSENTFSSHVTSCGRLKKYTFETNEDGTPIVVGVSGTDHPYMWYGQTLNFSDYVGYLTSTGATNIQKYAGFTEDTRVTDDTTYQALKDNPDYWTTDINYARYNHDSAVETINSLPDVSSNTQTSSPNSIKFKGAAGAKTDGRAINTLTEEEIAVATAKGWTVTLA